VLNLIARVVRHSPEAVALEERSRHLTYAQLDARTNALAHRLRVAGIGAERVVAICTRPSIETVIAMIAVWKAGGAFALVDVTSSMQRAATILADTDTALVLVDAACADLRACAGLAQLRIDADLTDRGMLATQLERDQLAYVVFTSGSTGRPKGVAVTHAGIANLIERQIETFAIDTSGRVLQFASLGFDAVISEVFTALVAGATLCLEDRKPGQEVSELLVRRAITVVTLPPSLLRVVSPADLTSLRTVVSAGEACTVEVVTRWANARRMVNAYGPSECTVCATMKAMAGPSDTPTIGRAMSGIDVYVLDHTLAPVAGDGGSDGEIYLGGASLARGYLGAPALTAERFVPNPFGGRGARMYRTGDRVRVRVDDELDYLGRSDDQVKIRGYRVEPGEVAVTLRELAGVDDALVIPHVRDTGDVTLIAYVVSRGLRTTERELLESVRGRLPAFLCPSEVVVIEAWPRTASGKIDRVALAQTRGAEPALVAPPRTATEERLAELVRSVLDRTSIDLDRSFFEQGGDSIAAVRLVIAIAIAFDIRLAMAALFENATLRELARNVDRLVAAPASTRGVPHTLLRAGDVRRPIWLLAPVHGNALCYLQFAQLLPPGLACYGLQSPGIDGEADPIDDFVALAAHHVRTIREQQPRGPYVLGGWSMGGCLAFEIAVQLRRAGEQVSRLFLLGATPPSQVHIDFARGAMATYEPWRIAYFYLRSLAFSLALAVPLDIRELANLSERDLFERFVAELRMLGPLGASITPELAQRWLGVVRATLYGFHHHEPSGLFDGQTLVVHASGQNPLDHDALVHARPVPQGRWEEHLVGQVESRDVAANHYTLLLDPWVGELASLVGGWLVRE
jgi:amino acid adenylation domain-containing protein